MRVDVLSFIMKKIKKQWKLLHCWEIHDVWAVVNKNGWFYAPFQFTTTRDFRDIRDKTGGDKITRTVSYAHGKVLEISAVVVRSL